MPLITPNINTPAQQALSNLQASSAVSNIANGTIAQGIVQAVNASFGQYYKTLTTDVAQAYISTAYGANLDLIGVLLNTPRGGTSLGSSANTQQFYTSTGNFGTLNWGTSPLYTIPAGTIVSNASGSIQYEVVSSVTGTATTTSILVSVQAVTPGSAANVGTNILTSHNLNIANLLTTNIASITNGSDTQTDPEYKYFLSKAVTAAQAGNLTAITLAALSQPGVSNIIPIPYYFGVGSTKIIVVGTVPVVSLGTLQAVQNAVNQVASISEFVTVQPPRYIGVDVTVKLIFTNQTTSDQFPVIANQVTNNIYNYINNLQIGQDFIRDQLINVILNTSTSIQDIDNNPASPTYMKIDVWTPTTVSNTNGVIIANYIISPLSLDYDAYFDDKLIIMQSLNGFNYTGTPVIVTY